jgi:hypothetical protein
MDEGLELGPVISRSKLTVMAVRRSHFEAVGDNDRLCHSAVFIKKGVFGSNSFSKADGEESMIAVVLRGPRCAICLDSKVAKICRKGDKFR